MLEKLKKSVCDANLMLVEKGLVILSWGNASGIDRKKGLIVIKPSGVNYSNLKPSDMVVVDLKGKIIEGSLRPSSDTPTHLVLYNHFKDIGGVVHTHSEWAVSWAQAGLNIPPLGTTHADHFYGDIPCTRKLTKREIDGDYEVETGNVIVETFKNLSPMVMPGVLVNCHGPFTWGNNTENAVENAMILEEVAKMAFRTLKLKEVLPVEQALLDKHYLRKHGKKAYYGQKKNN
jgi:Ribulose-5-phosphate 4-epimerase and related epimerases and aldolases